MSAGTLALGDGAALVGSAKAESGAILAGDGTLGSYVELAGGGVLEPGGAASVGTLHIRAGFHLDDGGELDFNLGQGGASDLVAVTGAFKPSGGVVFNFSDASGAPQARAIYTSLTFASTWPQSSLSDVTYSYTGTDSSFSGHFLLGSTFLLFVMDKVSQSIGNFMAAPADPVYSPGGKFTVSATPGAPNNPVAFAIAASSASVCSISDATVNILTAGACAATAN